MKKRISKYIAAAILAAAVSVCTVCAAISCSSVNNSTSTVNSSTTKLSAKNASKIDGNNYYANYGSTLTLNASNTNLSKGTVTYSFYCNNTLLISQTKNNTYQIDVNQTTASYYVVVYVNGVKETTSNIIKVIALYDTSKFNAAIYQITNNNNTQEVSTINDVNNTKSYSLIYHVLYDNKIYDALNSKIIWTINGQISNNNNYSIDINNLKPGINTISASTSFNIPNSNQKINIKPTTLIINVAQLEITGNDVKNNNVIVDYNASLTLKLSDQSLSSLADANITNATYQWYEINNKQSTKIKGQTNKNLVLTDLTNNATYYLVVSWTDNGEIKTLTSNFINVTINITNNQINEIIANKLDSILNQEINISRFNTTTALDALSNVSSDNLKTAIITTIENEITQSKEAFNIDAVAYTASEIASNITVKLPSSISSQENENQEIIGVLLNYNNIALTAKTGETTFIITGFKKPTVIAKLICNVTNSSSYVYNSLESKLIVWTDANNTNPSTVNFTISGITYNKDNKYEIKFLNSSSSNIIQISLNNNKFSIPISDFNGYSSLELLINNKVSSQVINYQYLSTKPYFQISNESFDANNPQITLSPNEDLGSCKLAQLSTSNLNLTMNINNTVFTITSTSVSIPAIGTVSWKNFYTIKTSNQNFIISFNKSELSNLLEVADASGSWTTINITVWIDPTTLNNNKVNQITLDGEEITQSQTITKTFGYANTTNAYTAGIYYNNNPVTSVVQGSSNVTLQVTGVNNGDKVQWQQEITSGQYADLSNKPIIVNNNNNATYSLPPSSFLNANQQITYRAIITTQNDTQITTNSFTVTVTSLGSVSINIKNVSPSNDSYSLTSNTSYNIQTSNNNGITLNDNNNGTTYYQWQYKSNSLILGNLQSNGVWTNLGNASSTYSSYQYMAIPMYAVSFRLVVFSDKTVPTSFNSEYDFQYIVSNTINTMANFTSTFSLSSAVNTINLGSSITYTLVPSEEQQLISLVEHSQYKYANNNEYFVPVTVQWFYENNNDTSISDINSPITEDILIHNGQLSFATYNSSTKQYSYSDSLSYTFSSALLSEAGSYDIYAKINFTNNFSPITTSKSTLTINSYKQAIEQYIENWASNINQEVSQQPNTTFTDFVQQNTQGVKILNTGSDFSDIKVSFTKLPSSDAEALGSLANDEWLTITATSNTTIDLTTWSGSSWETNTVKTVEQGYIFTWTLPYNLSSITYNNWTIELPINQNALNLQNNTDDFDGQTSTPSLTIPFGLAIGTISNPTSVSSTWSSSVITQYNGYICTNFETGQDAFSLPSPWIVSNNNKASTYNNLFSNKTSSKLINSTDIHSNLLIFFKHY